MHGTARQVLGDPLRVTAPGGWLWMRGVLRPRVRTP